MKTANTQEETTLGSETIFDGAHRLALLSTRFWSLDTPVRCGSVHCWLHYSCGCAVYRDGIRLELFDGR